MPHPSVSVRRGVTAAILTLLASACSRDVLDPASPRAADAGPRLTTASAGQPKLILNTVKYRDLGAKPATGRSGTSTLTTRALLGKDGVTELEVTTGTFDPVPQATRPLTRLQVKQLDSLGHSLRTINHNDLAGGGTASFRYEGLARGTTLQVQGNVAEDKRTAVVTVTGTVQLRPDLRVRLEAPPQEVRVGLPVSLVATVSEGNGDVGARADCVLYVDGTEADRARGIWVDAGDAVSCMFTHVFESVGTKQLRVQAESVSPGDYDPSNNAAEGTVQVTGGGNDFTYSAFAEDYTENSVRIYDTRAIYDVGQVEEFDDTTYRKTTVQSGSMYGTMQHGVSLATTRVHVSQSTNGVTAHDASWLGATGHEYPPLADQADCMSRWSEGAIFFLCSTGTADDGTTSFQYVRGGVQVTYYGVQHIRSWWADAPDDVYTYDIEFSGGFAYDGQEVAMGPDYSISVELTDAGRSYRVDAIVTLGAPESWTWSYYPPDGKLCYNEYVPDRSVRWEGCEYHHADVSSRRGFTVGYTE